MRLPIPKYFNIENTSIPDPQPQAMHCITLESDDPYFNLAIEEVLLKNSKEDYLILGINKPSLIIGKHQSAHKEVNTKFITENGLPVIRRISGGGTVFHDLGNLNFTFIKQSNPGKQIDFRKYTLPVIEFLYSKGVLVKFEGKNDLKVEGFKFSGNAEHVYRDRVLHHGTILFSTSLDLLGNAIRKDKSCFITRAVESNPSPVMNLSEKLAGFRDIYELRSEMMNYFLRTIPEASTYGLSSEDIKAADILANTKYLTWEWNWAYGPEYSFKNTFHFKGNPHHCFLDCKDGIITTCSIEGSREMLAFSDKVIGCRHMVADVSRVFKQENITISDEEIYNFF
jgi:lipoate-protein ligase A